MVTGECPRLLVDHTADWRGGSILRATKSGSTHAREAQVAHLAYGAGVRRVPVETEWTTTIDGGADVAESDQISMLDVFSGAAAVVVGGIADLSRRGTRRAASLVERLPPPPPLPAAIRLRRKLNDLAVRGHEQQLIIARSTSAWLDVILPKIVATILERVDLTSEIQRNLDIDALIADVDIDAIVRKVDVDAIISRVDLVTLVKEVMNAIDVPEIIRESTASVASDNVREVRMQSIAGDEAVRRVVARLTHRRRRPQSASGGQADPEQALATAGTEQRDDVAGSTQL
jgi:hypothetical protein